jgi:hypothetical protein
LGELSPFFPFDVDRDAGVVRLMASVANIGNLVPRNLA